jgi:3-hydroxyisobutyrate dehydrogenase-like beta-hydroxyacid dehydrogenase
VTGCAGRVGRVGFVGLGQMGAPMARHLVGRDLIVYDARAEAVAPLAEAGAEVATSPARLAAVADVVSVMVRDDDQVDDVVAEVVASARPGTVVAVHSTIRARTAVRLAERARPHGVEIVDAPVSGGFIGAEAGTLAVMVGGTEEAFELCREPFGAWADLILHMGPVGAGTRAKLARNLLTFVAFTAATEAQRLAEAAGIDLGSLGRVVRHSDGVTGGPGSIMLRDTARPLDPGDDLYPILDHVRNLGEKDLALAVELAQELAVETPLARLSLDRFAAGLGLPARRGGARYPTSGMGQRMIRGGGRWARTSGASAGSRR